MEVSIAHVEVRKVSEQRKFPERTGIRKEDSPENPRKKDQRAQNPERTFLLDFRKLPGAEGRNRVTDEERRQGPARLVQLHSQFREKRPHERQMHQKRTDRVEHAVKPTELHIQNDKHQHGHRKMATVKLRNPREHKRDHGKPSIGIAELRRKEKAREDKEKPGGKRGSRHNRKHPRERRHIA